MMAADRGDYEICELLLEHGSAVDLPQKVLCPLFGVSFIRRFHCSLKYLISEADLRTHWDSMNTGVGIRLEGD